MSQIGVYYETWSEKWTSDATKTGLSLLDKPITIVYLAFASPDSKYVAGQKTFVNSGLSFCNDWNVVTKSIQILKQKGILVMLSVGGGSYWSNTKVFNASNCVALMNDLGCDGIDLDWENSASKDYELTNAIASVKPLLNGKKLSFAGFGTGAYGKQAGDTYKGNAIDAMTKQGSNVDWINIMAYDGGKNFDPLGSFAAYQVYFKGPLLLGFEVGKQGWGDDLLTQEEVEKNCGVVKAQGKQNGIMIWANYKSNDGLTPSTKDVIKTAGDIFNNSIPPPPVPAGYIFPCPNCKKEFKITIS